MKFKNLSDIKKYKIYQTLNGRYLGTDINKLYQIL